MFNPLLHAQAIAVLIPSSVSAASVLPAGIYLDDAGNSQPGHYFIGRPSDVVPQFENIVFKEALSSVPVIWETQLAQDYQELGAALTEMTELDQSDEWKIDAPVYDAARRVAFTLMVNSIPAPQIFHHGSQSVVFNWTDQSNNLYLTISSDKMSALISTPERIKHRIEFSLPQLQNPSQTLRQIQSGYLEQPVVSTLKMASDSFESVG